MKTSLVSSAVSSASIKADRPQQLKSVTVYWRGRKMVLMQRPQRRLSVLLCRMLRRSMQSLFGTLIGTLANKGKRALGTAALATGALASMSAYAGITDITLPVNGTVQSGAAAISTVGNQMTVTQATDKAIIDWQSFSIGSKAGVNFIQNNANSVALNRVTGNDPSLIMGSLTANGKLFLVNAAGILVGKHAKIDVAGFVASTLNISNADFLAGKMNFAAEAGKHIGNVKNKGEITVHDGGSVYLIGANVENDGIINAPNGEVLLAAGRVVKLIDTTLPGVSIDVGGIAGKVTNLGRIMASAGTVGIGAALIDNSGTINASSVTKEGGRIFLRASQDLTTSSTSMINADGTVGGNVVLYADHSANIDGDVSALGSAGKGGYVDTSGKQQLSVMYKPRIGAGGEWYIDPTDVNIVDTTSGGGLLGIVTGLLGVITGNGSTSDVLASTITDMLNQGTSVSIVTGGSNDGVTGHGLGDIWVKTNVVTSNATGSATLSLNAAHDIHVIDNVTIGDGGQTNSLRLKMVAGYTEASGVITPTNTGNIQVTNATIAVGGGLETHAANYAMNGGSLTVSGTSTINSPLTASANSAITINNGSANFGAVELAGSTSTLTIKNSQVDFSGAVTGSGAGAGTLKVTDAGADHSAVTFHDAVTVDTLQQSGGSLTGTSSALTVNSAFSQTGGTISFNDVTLNQSSGALSVGKVTASNNLTLTAAAGAILQSDTVTASNVIANATSGITLNNAANNIAHFTATNTGDNDMALRTVSAVSLGAINNGGTHNLTINAGGAVTQTGIITAKNMAVTAAGGITLNLANQVEDLSATNSATGHIAFNSNAGAGLMLEQMTNTATGGNITVVATGPLSLNGAITTPNQVSLTSSSTIVQATGINGIVAASLIATAHGGMNFSSGANRVASFAATNYNNGAITLINNHGLTSGAGLNLGNVKQLTPTEGLHDVTITNAGTITASGQIDSGNGAVTVESESGDVGLKNVNAGSLNITASMGSITQTGAFTTSSLQATALNGITLNNAGNMIDSFAATNSGTGSIGFTNAKTNTLTLGILHNDAVGGNITILTGGGLSTSDVINAGGAINMTSAGNLTIGDTGIVGHDISLTSTSGEAITINGQMQADETSGTITVNSAGALTQGGSASISAGGAINMTSVGDLTIGADVSGHGINLTATGGGININDQLTVDATTGTVTLDSAHRIQENYGGGITAGTVNATARNGSIYLAYDDSNHIKTFIGTATRGTADNGDITVGNTGNLALGNVRADDGVIGIETVGTLTVNDGAVVTGQQIALTTMALPWQGEGFSETQGGDKPTPVNANMTISGSLTATGEFGVTLQSDGAITQQGIGAGTGIVANALYATALHGITLNSDHNNIDAFVARNGVNGEVGVGTVISGNIALTTLGALTLSGDVVNSASTGNVTIVADGNIVSTSNHGDGGDVNRTSSNGTVTLTSTNGNVTLGRVDAVDLAVNAHGLINQESTDTGGLTVTGTMNANASTGITLDHSSGTCGTNHIANFGATNNTSGDITLINVSTEDTVNNLVQITNSGGGISVDNTGAMKTTGLISAPHGSVTLRTHSPLTIGAGGISAGNGVTLTAGTGASASDALTLNGVIQTTLGNLTFGGNSVTPNAPIFGPNAPIFNSTTPVVPGPNFAFNPVTVVTPTVPPPVVVTNTTVDQNVASTSNVSGNLADAVVPTTNNQQNTTSSLSNQTAGGGDGEFGGSKDDGKERNTKSNKPLPVCS